MSHASFEIYNALGQVRKHMLRETIDNLPCERLESLDLVANRHPSNNKQHRQLSGPKYSPPLAAWLFVDSRTGYRHSQSQL